MSTGQDSLRKLTDVFFITKRHVGTMSETPNTEIAKAKK
jgi:hypothetical protein